MKVIRAVRQKPMNITVNIEGTIRTVYHGMIHKHLDCISLNFAVVSTANSRKPNSLKKSLWHALV